MPRAIKILAWTIGVLLVLPLVLIALVLTIPNVDWGRHLIEDTTARLTGGKVVLSGLAGHFPDDLRVARIELREGETPWLVAEDVALRWSPTRLARKALDVELLHAGRIQLLRLPPPSPKESNKPFELPLRVDVARIEVTKLDIGAPIAGTAASATLEGHVHAASLQDADVALTVQRLDSPGRYALNAHIDPENLKADLDAAEPAGGLLAGLAKLPDLGALSIKASAEGPRNAEAMRLTVAAGPLRATGQGKVDLVRQSLDVDLAVDAPAMSPREDVSWQSVSVQAHVHGPFTGPDATGQVRIAALKAGGAELRNLSADVQGNRGAVSLHAVLERLRIPGPKPDLLQSAPVDVRADARQIGRAHV